MATLDDDLAKAVTEGFRLAQSSIINQDLILSGAGDVTVTLADGSKKTGPSWTKLIAQAGAAGASAAAAKTSETNAKTSETNANSSKTAAATSATNAKTSETNAKTSETNAKTSETNAKTSETDAAASASSAAASLAAAQLLTSVPYEDAPYPDVWAPLSDDLRLLAGFAPYDKLTISGQVLELPSKSVTLTRAGTGTYTDKSGVLRTAAINEPRFEKEGLLIEEQRTNQALYSQDLSNAYWPKARVITTTGFSAPDGSNNAIKLIPNTEAASSHYISKPLSAVAGNAYVWSIFVKAGEYTKCRLNFSGSATTNNMSCDFDLITGTATGVTSEGVPTITPLADGWFRVSSKTEVYATSGVVNINIWIMEQNTTTFTGDGIKGLYIWGAQFEQGATMTSFIPTTTATVTRAADDCILQRSGNDNWWGPITIALELHCNGVTSSGASTSDRRGILAFYPSSTEFAVMMLDASSTQSGRLAFAYGPATYNFYTGRVDDGKVHTLACVSDTVVNKSVIDGGAPSNPTPTSRPTPDRIFSANTVIYLGRGAGITTAGQRMLNGHIRNLRIWHRALTDNQIRGLR
ncbi:hypothetical protein ES815_23715 [Leclercia adecarboxylata]|uniref:Phage tail protein n=2 Tax=Leclercia adecarboxylata TaxID=83655 RepID=A0AAP9DE95_9ENTR|nr:LamG domain-containing protein [Leclercia adecarboxylata]QDK21155.1 hypothetical protein ES815_23715 [Leclercia adecarboxylata]